MEHGGPDCLIDHADGPLPMSALLPYAFDDTDLGRVASPGASATPTVPAALALKVGTGTVFVHPDVADGRQVWTAYWERSSGTADGEPAGILEEGPTWGTAAEASRLGPDPHATGGRGGRAGHFQWAGDTPRPAGIEQDWSTP